MLTLGINYSQMHDSSACIVRDGELLFAVAEERISRLKHDARFPENAIQACLDFACVRAAELDEVCFGWQTAGPVFRHDLKCYATRKMPLTYLDGLNSTLHFLSMWHQASGAKKFAQQFGPTKAKARFIDLHLLPYRVPSRQLATNGSTPFASMTARLGPARAPESDIDDRCKNIAYAVQDVCETAMMNVVKLAIGKTGCRNVCLAGGVALNSKANGKILASGLVDQFFVQPAASDDGVALGAALAPYLDNHGRVPIKAMRHGYWGPSFDDGAIESALKTYKLRYTRVRDPASTAAELLANGKILGWFQGRMEFGPRALGNRSILADPRDPEMNAKVNNAVKFREWWRPFAPSFKKEVAGEYLESATDSPFMIVTAQVRPEKRSVIPSVTHVDGSARPQTVEKEINPLYWRLIDEFCKRTGVPVVMNTSFNLRGEAIVHTPTDAVRTFFSSGMDALVIGSFLVEK